MPHSSKKDLECINTVCLLRLSGNAMTGYSQHTHTHTPRNVLHAEREPGHARPAEESDRLALCSTQTGFRVSGLGFWV